ncbi:glycosyltransferase family 1 protein [Vibrio tubiashii]|uniref:Glycosyltransferase family 1 protein n=1 Tax=Vibrio tubiashii TaxID=29498 RepID=A0AAE5GT40_9VIBR|nr:glycosyltransferase [Vibrio tubiashii]NOI82329.1 glycosyltransferase family 1 protein [Vibrio tubiashii]
MKILVIDCNVLYFNPTRLLTPYFMSRLGDVTFFGPGYSSEITLSKGVEKFIETTGPYDAIIRTEHGMSEKIVEENSVRLCKDKFEFYQKNYGLTFPLSHLDIFWKDKGIEKQYDCINVVSMLQFDYQALGDHYYQYLLDNADLIIGVNKDFWEERDYSKLTISKSYTHSNRWYDLVTEHDERIIGVPHFVAPNEFNYLSLGDRVIDWSILGASYPNRRQAKAVLKSNDIIFDQGRNFHVYSMIIQQRLGFKPYSKERNIGRLNKVFFDKLANSKFSYTCGSDMKMPIRKFFEIPASGSLLVCDPCIGFEKLGFEADVSAIIASSDSLPKLNKELLNDIEHAQLIASRGQKVVLDNHTVDIRAEQLRATIERVVNKNYSGSYWSKGKLEFR